MPQKLSRKTNQLVCRFERAVRMHAWRGHRMPQETVEIDEEYERAKRMLRQHLETVERREQDVR